MCQLVLVLPTRHTTSQKSMHSWTTQAAQKGHLQKANRPMGTAYCKQQNSYCIVGNFYWCKFSQISLSPREEIFAIFISTFSTSYWQHTLTCVGHVAMHPSSLHLRDVSNMVDVQVPSSVEAMVRGCYNYKDIWATTHGEELACKREASNRANAFAVAELKMRLL